MMQHEASTSSHPPAADVNVADTTGAQTDTSVSNGDDGSNTATLEGTGGLLAATTEPASNNLNSDHTNEPTATNGENIDAAEGQVGLTLNDDNADAAVTQQANDQTGSNSNEEVGLTEPRVDAFVSRTFTKRRHSRPDDESASRPGAHAVPGINALDNIDPNNAGADDNLGSNSEEGEEMPAAVSGESRGEEGDDEVEMNEKNSGVASIRDDNTRNQGEISSDVPPIPQEASEPGGGLILSSGDTNNNNAATMSNEADPVVRFIQGPNHWNRHANNNDDNNASNYPNQEDHDESKEEEDAHCEVVLEGFLPPQKKKKKTPAQSRADELERQRQQLLDGAITLHDSAVKIIPDKEEQRNSVVDEEEAEEVNEFDYRNDNTGITAHGIKHFWNNSTAIQRAIYGAVLVAVSAGIILGIVFGTERKNDKQVDQTIEESTQYSCNEPSQLKGDASFRYKIAKPIISTITPTEILDDRDSPQSKALQWIVCHDEISSNLLNQYDESTQELPKQTNGFAHGGDSGEAQVLRRYILTTVYYSTSEKGPWADDWNFLSPSTHECSWHKNYTRSNWPYGDLDPAGIVCEKNPDEGLIYSDEEFVVNRLFFNFRIENELTGSLPREFGHLVDMANIMIESQEQLSGSLPPMSSDMGVLNTVAVLFNGPNFGGEIPASLFSLSKFQFLSVQNNLGSWSLPSDIDKVTSPLSSVDLKNTGFSGKIPSWLLRTNVTSLDLSNNDFYGPFLQEGEILDLPFINFLNVHGNKLNGTLPESLGDLSTMAALAFGDNGIHGSIPESMGRLANLELLELEQNRMTGSIPQTFANLTKLKHLVLSSNSFNGTIDVLESMGSLESALIHSNQFSGSLPGALFHSIPSDVLVYLDVGNNFFEGGVPESYGSRANLTYFVATQNGLDMNSVDDSTCSNVPFLYMDCSACTCCDVCCNEDEGKGNEICHFHMSSYIFLGLECGLWWMYCGSPEAQWDTVPTI